VGRPDESVAIAQLRAPHLSARPAPAKRNPRSGEYSNRRGRLNHRAGARRRRLRCDGRGEKCEDHHDADITPRRANGKQDVKGCPGVGRQSGVARALGLW